MLMASYDLVNMCIGHIPGTRTPAYNLVSPLNRLPTAPPPAHDTIADLRNVLTTVSSLTLQFSRFCSSATAAFTAHRFPSTARAAWQSGSTYVLKPWFTSLFLFDISIIIVDFI